MRTVATIRISLLIAFALIAPVGVLTLAGGQAASARGESTLREPTLAESTLRESTLVEPTVPEPVATYFASGLVPRLADLYGPGKQKGSGIDFGSTTKVGDIHRVFSWTTAFLAGKKTGSPTELTNDWIAPVSVKDRSVGLATVWINPSSDDPELANFDLGPGLVTALAAAPKGDVLVRDSIHSAWFATDGTTLVPLVSGTSGIATTTTIDAYQKSLPQAVPPAPVTSSPVNQSLINAGIVLFVVVALLALFVLLPDRRRRRARTVDDGGFRRSTVVATAAPVSRSVPGPVAEQPAGAVIRTRSAQSAATLTPPKPPNLPE